MTKPPACAAEDTAMHVASFRVETLGHQYYYGTRFYYGLSIPNLETVRKLSSVIAAKFL